ncbi:MULTISPECIES: DUF4166 domain-containing protein [Kitasatospora]|uniref:DUF4166 domain-containing protein n=1 Tax=Kitasatospora setae (strain ATCC 33774 / DSM 43861 / JCM 3304 / KCC A-0304 / NBRC 14216 / KM-6054) TaxID=452652 RepID=E4NHS3_KITSK|nr:MULTISPECIES: DUF4166 domain-containing protein [Kitasatospora]BAJ31053.1 hypothetical protein KSE_52770 [Kitasatospora setae KM-6054]
MTVISIDPDPRPVPVAGSPGGSIFRAALGAEFERLHPELRRRFGFSSADGIACLGTGRMEQVERGARLAAPFLRVAARRNILFPEHGRDVPFTIANYAYRDGYGRETVTFVRTFQFVRPRRFDATMVASPRAGTVVDYLGTHQHLAVDLRLGVSKRGGLVVSSAAQRVSGWVGAPVLPELLAGRAELHEWFDEAEGRFRIRVRVVNPVLGLVAGYRGWFRAEYPRVGAEGVPGHVRPVRESFRR